MIEVFKTNVQLQKEALQLTDSLKRILTHTKINFDLEDRDKILRIEGTDKSKNKYIMSFLEQQGYHCEILE